MDWFGSIEPDLLGRDENETYLSTTKLGSGYFIDFIKKNVKKLICEGSRPKEISLAL